MNVNWISTPLLLWSLGLLACAAPPRGVPAERAPSSPVDALVAGGDAEGFARAEAPRDFVFPLDHGPHPDFQTEWWYVTANLETAEGRRFGVQWTLFRRALAPEMSERSSDWASRQLFMGHVALSDVDGGRQLSSERFSRGGAGLAGAELGPFRVWLEDWRARSLTAGDLWPLRVEARASTAAGEFSLDLELDRRKPMVLQGDRGLSRKHEGGASYYYSFTRLAAAGTLEVDDEAFEVRGSAWLDREWSTSTLERDQAGWDWFSLQLDDERDLMYYQLRQTDGSAHPMSAGVLVDPDGVKTPLGLDDVELEVLETWRSPRSGGVYPARWRLRVPSEGLDLEIVPVLDDQELDVAFRYWEGAVDVRGAREAGNAQGRGYVELVGYADD